MQIHDAKAHQLLYSGVGRGDGEGEVGGMARVRLGMRLRVRRVSGCNREGDSTMNSSQCCYESSFRLEMRLACPAWRAGAPVQCWGWELAGWPLPPAGSTLIIL